MPLIGRMRYSEFLPIGGLLLFFGIDQVFQPRLVMLMVMVLSAGIVSCLCQATKKNGCVALVFWICFAWLYRMRYVGLSYLPGGLLQDARQLQNLSVVDSFFSWPFSSVELYALAHITVPLLGAIAIFVQSYSLFRIFSVFAVLTSVFVMLNQYGLANQMATTTFWSCGFLFWFANKKKLQENAANVSQLVVSFIFMGAFLGKVTPEYWNNEIPSKLGQFTPWVNLFGLITTGRLALVAEGLAAFSVLLNPKIAACYCLTAVAGMFYAVSPAVIDATGPIVGLCMCSLVIARVKKHDNVTKGAEFPKPNIVNP